MAQWWYNIGTMVAYLWHNVGVTIALLWYDGGINCAFAERGWPWAPDPTNETWTLGHAGADYGSLGVGSVDVPCLNTVHVLCH